MVSLSVKLAMTYAVRLINEKKGLDRTFQVKEDQKILEIAEQQGMTLPYSCRTGVCSVCTGRLTEGTANQDEGTILTEEQQAAGFILTCIAYPRSDCTILTEQESELF
jgi:ferredoxin